jgi:hypothetical protein
MDFNYNHLATEQTRFTFKTLTTSSAIAIIHITAMKNPRKHLARRPAVFFPSFESTATRKAADNPAIMAAKKYHIEFFPKPNHVI